MTPLPWSTFILALLIVAACFAVAYWLESGGPKD
jgi:hypothetical protein